MGFELMKKIIFLYPEIQFTHKFDTYMKGNQKINNWIVMPFDNFWSSSSPDIVWYLYPLSL